jgi:signal transduction histidine kinase
MPVQPARQQGLGLRIMQNRAAIIGARLTIEPARPSGTLGTCVLARRNHERNQNEGAGPGPDRR